MLPPENLAPRPSSSLQQSKEEPTLAKKSYMKMPQKGKYRMRAHINPLMEVSIPFPAAPRYVDWSLHYPLHFGSQDSKSKENKIYTNTGKYPIQYMNEALPGSKNGGTGAHVNILDMGCGYGNLLVEMAKSKPQLLFLGLQIRDKVVNFVGEKIRSVRHNQDVAWNAGVIRTNAMKLLLNYFRKAEIEAIFFCFPDPHFKKSNFRRRIINRTLLTEYAYILKPGGRLYTITDVMDLYEWEVDHLERHPLFRRIPNEEMKDELFVKLMHTATDQSHKVDRKSGSKYFAVYERIEQQSSKSHEESILDLLI